MHKPTVEVNDRVLEKFSELPTTTTLPMLLALNATGKNLYPGTVPAATIQTRRAKNKVARKSRRVNAVRNFRKGVR